VYLLVDGLGSAQVDHHLAEGRGEAFFAREERHALTTVFPSTTSAAVTTFTTGTTPSEHGIVGWHVQLPDLGGVATVLLGTTRTEAPMMPEGFDWRGYYRIPSHVESAPCRKVMLSYGNIASRPFNRALTRWDATMKYRSLTGLAARIAEMTAHREPSLGYAYWPRFDALSHEHGDTSTQAGKHFRYLDRSLAQLREQLRGTGTVLCVSADHGFDSVTPEGGYIDLFSLQGFRDCLATAPAGDPRQVQCFVRPDRVDEFRAFVSSELGHACACMTGEQLLDSGALGPGAEHPELRRRVGDFVLLARPGWALAWDAPGLPVYRKVGNHGGMSEREMWVPLYIVGP
jgi:hypothetical protein